MSPVTADALEMQLRQRLFTPLGQLRYRVRLYLGLEGLRILLVVLLVAGTLQLLLDRWLRLSLDQRAVLSGLLAAGGLWIVYRRLLVPLLRPLPDRFLASLMDRAHPELCDQLATAVQLATGACRARRESGSDRDGAGGMSPDLVRAVLQGACRSAATVSFVSLLNHRRAARRAVEVCGLFLLAAASMYFTPELVGTWFARNWLLRDLAWPQRTYIWPDGFGADGRRRMARGDMIEITAVVRGLVPATALLDWWTPSSRRGRESMSVVGDTQLSASVGQLSEDIHFRIAGGDERTREFVVEAAERPRVLHTLARITPPAYTRGDPVVIEQQTVFEILLGSNLEFTALLNKPVKSARFVGADGADTPGAVSWTGAEGPPDDQTEKPSVRVEWHEPMAGMYRFELTDSDGLTNQNPLRYTLKVVPDLPPDVQVELTGVGELITPQAELPIVLRCEDAYGLSAVRLLLQAGAKAEQTTAVEGLTPGVRSFSSKFMLAVAATGVVPTDRLRLSVQAADLDPHGPNVAMSPATTLRVVSREEFRAEMARRELTLRQEFERLRSGQRGLKDALERVLASLPAESLPPDATAARLAGLARTQTEQASRCLTVGRGFDQVLAEMQVSRVAGPADERRITDRVVAPLEQLARETIPGATEAIAALRFAVAAGSRQACLAAQGEVLRRMDEILANMLEWEGYREAVALLQEVIETQTTVRTDTLHAVEHQLDDILGPAEPREDPGSAPPKR